MRDDYRLDRRRCKAPPSRDHAVLWSTGGVNPVRRRVFALFALVAVLFSQLAVAAYACPGADGMFGAAIAQQEAPPCHEQEPQDEPGALCNAHCQQGSQSFAERGASLPAVSFVALPSSMIAPRADLRADAPRRRTQVSLLERPTGPPLAVRHCRFNI
jgi:hypothetical protein